ncbi:MULTISPECIES: hypothetical protein [Bradyrhizobium]|uniref:Uncharacterized protein n=1 Tax=Bradyrhizobium japonicum TaxID=375 RepID=A0A1Y2JR99_BRAJP|nr:hypothetical protein [Bradyrhizobium japonicum]OSJ32171.1 hypothetical protein BSZ19_20270 [Bradyrhizobium japonicum]
MFLFRRRGVDRTRLRIVRTFYQSFIQQNGPEARARRLLREWLSPDQCAQFDANDYFEVTGCHTGRRYRVHYGTMSNVVEVDASGLPVIGWCFVPDRTTLAAGDVMLAQKIALETDEAAVLALAHRFSPRMSRLRVVRPAY